MTYRDSEREVIAEELLLDADAADSADVRRALLSLGSFANLAAPTPGAELSAMLSGPHDEVSNRRWRRKHRTAVVGVAVVAAMGLGVSGVAAASSGFTRNPSFMDELLGNVRPQPAVAAPALPSPDAPRVMTEPAPAVDPAALPTTPAAESVPVPGSGAPAEIPAQTQAQAQVPAQPAAPGVVEAPAHNSTPPSGAVPGSAVSVEPPQTKLAPNLPLSPQPNPDSGKEDRSGKEDKSDKEDKSGKEDKQQAAKSAERTKPGHRHTALSDERNDEQLPASVDTWKQWPK